ncbi:MAG: 3-deoxy-8-phosphooctulonate synthase [Bacteroidales bacterium]|nr:3-deoxy-8-phosphooctulonate synthase [Bacteroidales bacterium]
MSKHIIKIKNINCGSDTMFLIAGPCVIENELIMFEAAEKLKKISEQARIPLIFKSSFQKDNRSALNNYKGPGLEEGLKMLQKIKKDFDLPILSDVHYPTQVKAAAEVLDIIQIPAYLCMQTDLVVEAAKTGRVINLKHGQFIAPNNMVKPLNKIIESGNNQIILTERGYTFGYNDLIVDPRSFYHLNNLGYPVVFDITHSVRRYGIPSFDPKGASREFLPVIARAGVAAGVDGIFIESHPDPSKALCDAASQINLNKLADFIKPLIELHSLVSKYRNNDTEQY